ncbi:MAG: ABC-2 family transporter protein [Patescibacteria group bacterium]|jgi:ABC-2 type transport system permease protein
MKILSNISEGLRVGWYAWRTNLRAAMEHRVAFALQVGGMVLNDSAFIAVWILFFAAVGEVNGWNGWDSVGLLGFGTLSYGLGFGFIGGSTWVCRYVADSSLDAFLLTPQNVLWRILISRSDITALGDVVFGGLLLSSYAWHIHASWSAGIFMMLAVLPATILTLAISISVSTFAFYFLDAEQIAFNIFKTFLSPSMYPSALFPSGAKMVFTFIIPSLLVAGLPVEMIKGKEYGMLGMFWGIAAVWAVFSVVLFYIALRRYESGNALGLRSGN